MEDFISILKARIQNLLPISHLLLALFLHSSAMFIVIPTTADVTMTALCPGFDECSQAIYLTGLQQAVTGFGTMIVTPVVGELSDRYGRKPLLLLAFTVTVIPFAVLSYSRTKEFIYAYYLLRTLASVVIDGNVQSLSLAYVADNVEDHLRASTFGILAGVLSFGFVLSTLAARILSEVYVFKVAMVLSVLSALYLKVFLVETNGKSAFHNKTKKEGISPKVSAENSFITPLGGKSGAWNILRTLKESKILVQIIIITFFCNLGEAGLHATLLYYLKAIFHFGKDEFSEMMLIMGVSSVISQFLLMPILLPILGEKKVLCIGLFASFIHALLYSIAWAHWVPYLSASMALLYVSVSPSISSIVSKEAGPEEQGKMQGLVGGVRSFAAAISPLAISPLSALFLSDNPPFRCQGFSIMCMACAMMIALVQGCFISQPPTHISCYKESSYVQVRSSDAFQDQFPTDPLLLT